MAHGDAREEKWRGNKRMEWVISERHMTAEHRLARAVQTLQADVHTSAASSRLNWRPRRFKWTRPFRRKTKSGFCACAITFQTQSTVALSATYRASLCVVLKMGHFGKRIRNSWKVLKCGAGEGWRRSVGPIVCKMKYYIESRSRGISYIQQTEGRVTGLVTSCVVSAFWNTLL